MASVMPGWLATNKVCFVCNRISSALVCQSIKGLQTYLKINPTEIAHSLLPNLGQYPSGTVQKLSQVVQVCEQCSKSLKAFTAKFVKLEKLKMEINQCLQEVHSNIQHGLENEGLIQAYNENMMENGDFMLKKSFVDVHRIEIKRKSKDFRFGLPVVKLTDYMQTPRGSPAIQLGFDSPQMNVQNDLSPEMEVRDGSPASINAIGQQVRNEDENCSTGAHIEGLSQIRGVGADRDYSEAAGEQLNNGSHRQFRIRNWLQDSGFQSDLPSPTSPPIPSPSVDETSDSASSMFYAVIRQNPPVDKRRPAAKDARKVNSALMSPKTRKRTSGTDNERQVKRGKNKATRKGKKSKVERKTGNGKTKQAERKNNSSGGKPQNKEHKSVKETTVEMRRKLRKDTNNNKSGQRKPTAISLIVRSGWCCNT